MRNTTIARVLCIVMLLLVAIAFTPSTQTWAASKPAKPKVSVSVTEKTVLLKWNKVKGAKKYQIYRATSAKGKYKKIKTTKKLKYNNKSLKTGKMYFYKVRAVKGSKRSKFAKVAATPMAQPACRPSSLISENKIRTITVRGATGYMIYRSTSRSSGYRYLGSTKTLAFDDKSAKTGITYYYKIRAYKSQSGYTTYSAYSTVRRAARLLAKPSLTSAVKQDPEDPSNKVIDITWTQVPAAKGYELYRSSDGGKNYTCIYRGAKRAFTDTVDATDHDPLKYGNTYFYKVRAYHTVFGNVKAYSYTSPSKHSRQKLVDQAKSWVGYDEKNKKFRTIVDIYNSYLPLPRDVKPGYDLAWCTTFVTACGIKADLVDIMPRERICRYMIDLYKELGQWVEKDGYTPKAGDLIMYDWDDKGKGDCTGVPEHIGIVVQVTGNNILVIEGNNNDYSGHPVAYREIKINGRYIRGFATPGFDVNNGVLFVLDDNLNAQGLQEEEPKETQESQELQEPQTEEPLADGQDENQVTREPEEPQVDNEEEPAAEEEEIQEQ